MPILEMNRGVSMKQKKELDMKKMLTVNNALFLIGIVVNQFWRWGLCIALAFWVVTLVCLIQQDRKKKNVSFTTAAYGIIALALTGYIVYSAIYNITH